MLLKLVAVCPCIVIVSPFIFVSCVDKPNVLVPVVDVLVPKFIEFIGSIIWDVKAKVPVPLGIVWVLIVERFIIAPLLKLLVPFAVNSALLLIKLTFPPFADNIKSFPDITLET